MKMAALSYILRNCWVGRMYHSSGSVSERMVGTLLQMNLSRTGAITLRTRLSAKARFRRQVLAELPHEVVWSRFDVASLVSTRLSAYSLPTAPIDVGHDGDHLPRCVAPATLR
jgi:hypothetical protein